MLYIVYIRLHYSCYSFSISVPVVRWVATSVQSEDRN